MTAEKLILDELKSLQAAVHDLRHLVQKLSVPVEVLTTEGAALRLGVSPHTVKKWAAGGVWTDARPPDRRKTTGRVFYADEIEAYRTDGPAGVFRLREKCGRL